MRFHRNPKYASYNKMLAAYQNGKYSAVVNPKAGYRNYYEREVTYYHDAVKLCQETAVAGLIALKRIGVCRDVRGIIAQFIWNDPECEGNLRRAAYLLQKKYPVISKN
jgi:hypothetical protein